jgi:hypothetical protein
LITNAHRWSGEDNSLDHDRVYRPTGSFTAAGRPIDAWRCDASRSAGADRPVERASEREEEEEKTKKKRMMGLEPTTFCMASRRSSQLSYIRVRRIIAAV